MTTIINTKDPEYQTKLQEEVQRKLNEENATENPPEDITPPEDMINIQVSNKRGQKTEEPEIKYEPKPEVIQNVFEWEDDLGEKISIEADLSDTEYVTNLLRTQKAYKDLESENQAMKDMMASKENLFKKKEEELAELIKLSKMSVEEKIEYLLKDKGGKSAYEKSIIDQYKQYEQMTDEEKIAYNGKQEEIARKKREEALIRKHEEALAEINKQKEELHKNSRLNMTRLAFGKHKIEGDSMLAKDANQSALTEANKALNALEASGIVLTQAIIDRELARAMNPRRKDFNIQKRESAKIQDELDKAASKGQSFIQKERMASSGHESKQQTFSRWANMVKSGKQFEITSEIRRDEAKAALFIEFAEKVKIV